MNIINALNNLGIIGLFIAILIIGLYIKFYIAVINTERHLKAIEENTTRELKEIREYLQLIYRSNNNH